jgi:hypothetical protein
MDRKTFDIVPVHRVVHLTTRRLNSLAEHFHEILASDPRLKQQALRLSSLKRTRHWMG